MSSCAASHRPRSYIPNCMNMYCDAPPYNIYQPDSIWGSRKIGSWSGPAGPYNIYQPDSIWGSHSSRRIGYDPRISWTGPAGAAAVAAARENSFYDSFQPLPSGRRPSRPSRHSNSYDPRLEGGKKRKTIKQCKSRKGRKSRRH